MHKSSVVGVGNMSLSSQHLKKLKPYPNCHNFINNEIVVNESLGEKLNVNCICVYLSN